MNPRLFPEASICCSAIQVTARCLPGLCLAGHKEHCPSRATGWVQRPAVALHTTALWLLVSFDPESWGVRSIRCEPSGLNSCPGGSWAGGSFLGGETCGVESSATEDGRDRVPSLCPSPPDLLIAISLRLTQPGVCTSVWHGVYVHACVYTCRLGWGSYVARDTQGPGGQGRPVSAVPCPLARGRLLSSRATAP